VCVCVCVCVHAQNSLSKQNDVLYKYVFYY